ncbi:protein inscuteable homolog [Hemiscyllium ocellatum]|uniref:protein inscuteable homolog n=1 Tax=Hemiscyllium ocellatum TaxID=170820 RepID=UPI002966A7AF|nr:protein inscuteable homolog [Hemiscyllium ocellatum]
MASGGGSLFESLSSSVQRMHLIQMDSVQRWMDDLRLMAECECMCILQSKPISVDGDGLSELVITSQQNLQDSLQTLLKRAWTITTELSNIFYKLEKNRWQWIHCTAVRLNCHVRSLISEYNSYTRNASVEIQQFETILLEKCCHLTTITESYVHDEDETTVSSVKTEIVDTLTSFSQSFSQMVELALTHEIQDLVMQLDSATSIYNIETAVSSLISLTQEGAHLCHIIAKEGGVAVLFKLCRQDAPSYLHVHALRALTSICSVEEGINELEKVDGVLCLADLLTNERNSEATRAEAAAVVSQITSPHVNFTQHLSSFLENMEDIVTALINLCKDASSSEVFLLASAALANITFFDSMACEILLQLNATKILIEACHDLRRVDTPYSKDQVVTILANMAVLDPCASEMVQENGIELLLEFLHEKISPGISAEGAALERVLQKSAVTLARLSRQPDITNIATSLNCIPRLIELCRFPSERNNSDSVLVACLAALRRLAASCPQSFEESDYQQLIKPRLVDSFLLCSNMEESFV